MEKEGGVKMSKTVEQLQEQTAQYAVEHITGKGLHKGIGWLRDSFNQLCEAMGIPDLQEPEEYDRDELVEFLKKAPWVADTLSRRHLVAQKVAIDCIYALNNDELLELDGVLADLEKNPELGKSQGMKR